MNQLEVKIKKIVIEILKEEATNWEKAKIYNWAGDEYLPKSKLKESLTDREKKKKGSKLLLKALKLLDL